jgi:hypothetical protein
MGRSVNTIVKMLGNQGVEVSRSSVYRVCTGQKS